jgi:LacI family transcriptional regulator
MTDVAEAAGVSPATVDRVLNRRKGVKETTVARVLREAANLGYVSDADYERLSHPRPLNLVFLLPKGNNPYLRLLGDKVRALAEAKLSGEAKIRCFFIESFDAQALAAALRHHAGWADGIAFMAIDHPVVREAVDELAARGKHVVTIVSDLPTSNRIAYVGLDNQAAGRTAGYLMGRFARTRGSVALVAGSRLYRAHAEREMGFLALLEEQFPELRVIGVREGHDDRDENYRHAAALLAQNADLVGIYNVGGSSDGIARALREKRRAGKVVFIGHGLTADTRTRLIDGTIDAIINSNPDAVLSGALRIFDRLRAPSPGRGDAALPAPITMDVVFRENLPYAG